jgi:hypothetical protein
MDPRGVRATPYWRVERILDAITQPDAWRRFDYWWAQRGVDPLRWRLGRFLAMTEEWLLAHAGNDANQSRIRYLLDTPPRSEPGVVGSASTPQPARRGGLTLAAAHQLLADLDEDERSTGG